MARFHKQFSIAWMLILTAIVAIVITVWPESEGESRVEEWSEHYWFDRGVGVVSRIGTTNSWVKKGVIDGEGSLCVLSKGNWIVNSTGGSYFRILVQLPGKIKTGDEFDIHPFKKNLNANDETSGEIESLAPGSMIAMAFGNPSSWELNGDSTVSTGKITVLASTEDSIKIRAEISVVLGAGNNTVPLKFDDTFEIDRGYPDLPLDTIERKITK